MPEIWHELCSKLELRGILVQTANIPHYLSKRKWSLDVKCIGCKAENPVTNKFCGTCGDKLPAEEAMAVAVEDRVYFCTWHKKEQTRVRCGRCETPICPRCAIDGPAG